MQTLPALVPELNYADIEVRGVRDDSRHVRQGDLFLAVSGASYTAQQMLEDIQDSGAAAALYDERETLDLKSLNKVPLFPVRNLREQRGFIASRFYGEPSKKMFVVGVTGTNGKTSCSQYIASALAERSGVVGTMGWGFPPILNEPGLTTPDAIRLQELFSTLQKQDAESVCLEASSHGLAQDRLSGIEIDAAVFTNLTRDHLDYHGSVEGYQAAKTRLFADFPIQIAILNHDDPFASVLTNSVAPGVKIVRYSLRDETADVYCTSLTLSTEGIEASIESPAGLINLRSSLIGEFNVSNLLAVVSLLAARGYASDDIGRRVSQLVNVRGRMDRIDLANGAVAVIDYAHTPDALENALSALRAHCDGQLICVMGCGGDRDVGKRPQMGEIASRLSDFVVVTDDNPRTEPSAEIIDHVMAGIHDDNAMSVSDRASAIRYALGLAKPGDVVLIAGKGHEAYQEMDGVREPFSDHEEVARFDPKQSPNHCTILGFGITGASLARYFAAGNQSFAVVEDTHSAAVVEYQKKYGPIEQIATSDLQVRENDCLMVSPGVSLKHPLVQKALAAGAEVSNDIRLFISLNEKALCLVTGSNGKSTVTSFVGQIFSSAGVKCGLGGNIGNPAIELLSDDSEKVVLEVSSYQLELARNSQADVAVLLNLTPDHLDRYDSVEDYYRAKTHIFEGAKTAVYGRDINFDLGIDSASKKVTFGLDEPSAGHYGIRVIDGVRTLVVGEEALIAVADLPYQGDQDVLNVLAATAVVVSMGLDIKAAIAGLSHLRRLEHRFEVLADTGPHVIVNDSKSTNPASTETAIRNLAGETRPVDLILGGIGKGADFSPLAEPIAEQISRCFIYGADRETIQAQLKSPGVLKDDLSQCLQALALDPVEPRVVLFSPACASQDQFENFAARGQFFKTQIRELI